MHFPSGLIYGGEARPGYIDARTQHISLKRTKLGNLPGVEVLYKKSGRITAFYGGILFKEQLAVYRAVTELVKARRVPARRVG